MALMDNNKVWFLSFCDRRWRHTRIKKEAVNCQWFDEVIVGDESLFDKWYYEKYKNRFNDRGFGYWQWKSYLIRKTLDRMDVGDYLMYADAGCTVNSRGKKRFLEYLKMANESASGIIAFVQSQTEGEYTKGDIFAYFNACEDPEMRSHLQIQSGTIVMQKKRASQIAVDEWYWICHNRYDLISDAVSVVPNFPEFVENRHDQSVWSFLSVKHGFVLLPACESYTDSDWETLKDYPLWASRIRQKRGDWLIKLYHSLLKRRK